MKKLLFILFTLPILAQGQWTYTVDQCRMKWNQGGIVHTVFNLSDLTYSQKRNGYIELRDGISVLTLKDGTIDTYLGDDIDSLITDIDTYVSSCPVSTTTIGNSAINVAYNDGATLDAFGRLRISDAYTIFDSKLLNGKAPFFWDEELNGTATATYYDTLTSVILATADSGDFAIRATLNTFHYQPGKSQRISFTGRIGLDSNTVKRYGYFNTSVVSPFTDSLSGIWVEQVGDNPDSTYWCIGNWGNVTRVPRSEWNVDKLNGSGVSKKTLDLTKGQIMLIDFGWLGYQRIRVGFIIDGEVCYTNYFYTANQKTKPFIQTPDHGIRAEIRQTGAGTGQLMVTCSEVQSEGGQEEDGIIRSVNSGGTGLVANVADTTYALIGIRLGHDYRDNQIELLSADAIITTASDNIRWSVRYNPTISGSPSWTALSDSPVEYFRGATANIVTGGTIVLSGYAATGNTGSGAGTLSAQLKNAIKVGYTIDGVPTTMVLCITPVAGSTAVGVRGSLNFREQ